MDYAAQKVIVSQIYYGIGINLENHCKGISTVILSTRVNEIFIFLSGFSFKDPDDSQDSRGKEGTILYSSLPLPPAQEHSDIYLQLCI